MADWNATGEQPAAAVAGATADDIEGIQGNVASLQGSVTDITEQMAELRTMLSQLMRGTTSTSRVRAVDGGGESRGGTHAAAGAGAGRARAPTGGGMGMRTLSDTEVQDTSSVGSSNVSLAGDPHGTRAFQFLNGKKCDTHRREVRWSRRKLVTVSRRFPCAS